MEYRGYTYDPEVITEYDGAGLPEVDKIWHNLRDPQGRLVGELPFSSYSNPTEDQVRREIDERILRAAKSL